MTTELNGRLMQWGIKMGKYTEFKELLEESLYEKLNRRYIEDVLSEGHNYVEFEVRADGSLSFLFDGKHRFNRSYSSLQHFKHQSENLLDLEGIGYKIVSSCVNAEKLTKNDIPSKYYLKIYIDNSEVFKIHVVV